MCTLWLNNLIPMCIPLLLKHTQGFHGFKSICDTLKTGNHPNMHEYTLDKQIIAYSYNGIFYSN